MRVVDAEELTRRITACELPECFRGCVMCAIAGGAKDSELVVRREPGAIVVVDRFAASRGHLLVILERHEEDIASLPWPSWERMQRLAWESSRALDLHLKPRRIFVAALGSATASAKSFPHLHLHVVPLHEDGESARPAHVFSWSRGVHVYEPGEAEALVSGLRDAWPSAASSYDRFRDPPR